MQRYFIKQEIKINQIVTLDGENAFHIGKVMRMTVGESVILCDNQRLYISTIKAISKNNVDVFVDKEIIENNEMNVEVTIAQGLVQKNKFEEIINKLTQLGAYSYIPLQLTRSNFKLDSEHFTAKSNRFEKIIKEASEQSHRLKLMKLEPLMNLKELVEILHLFDVVLVAYEVASNDLTTFKKFLTKEHKKILVIIGPEGGLTSDEVTTLTNYGAKVVSLGPRILRTETAPLYALSAISALLELE